MSEHVAPEGVSEGEKKEHKNELLIHKNETPALSPQELEQMRKASKEQDAPKIAALEAELHQLLAENANTTPVTPESQIAWKPTVTLPDTIKAPTGSLADVMEQTHGVLSPREAAINFIDALYPARVQVAILSPSGAPKMIENRDTHEEQIIGRDGKPLPLVDGKDIKGSHQEYYNQFIEQEVANRQAAKDPILTAGWRLIKSIADPRGWARMISEQDLHQSPSVGRSENGSLTILQDDKNIIIPEKPGENRETEAARMSIILNSEQKPLPPAEIVASADKPHVRRRGLSGIQEVPRHLQAPRIEPHWTKDTRVSAPKIPVSLPKASFLKAA